jgi:uncharacterized membrane protein YbhN (UPF0104 family)
MMKTGSLLKIVLTIVFFCILFYKIDFQNIITVIRSLNVIFLAFALAMVPLLFFVRTWRWWYFLTSMGIHLPFFKTVKIMLVGNFYGLITPGKIGEFGRVFHLDERKSVTIPTIIMEKILDIGVLLFLSVITVAYFFYDSSIMLITILIISFGTVGAILLSVNERFMTGIGTLFGIDPKDIGSFVISIKKLIRNYPVMFTSIAITFFYYFLAYCFSLIIIIAAGMKSDGMFTMPIIVLMGNIPITISGLGLRESIGSLCFVLLGETAANGFVFSLILFIFITVIPAICGYILTITGGINDVV